MIDFRKLTSLRIPVRGYQMDVKRIESGGVVIWRNTANLVELEVEKITSDTYADGATYNNESFILLTLYVGNGTPVEVTYGGVTKTVSFPSGTITQKVFFGTFNGVSDEVETPSSGILTIEGSCYAVATPVFYGENGRRQQISCVTGINSWGQMNRIEASAFYGGKALNITNIPRQVDRIGQYGFYGCSSITSIHIPDTVTRIDSYAFQYCSNLLMVTIDATTPPTLGVSVFNNTNADLQIIVPAGCGEAYRTASGWSSYADRIVEDTGNDDPNVAVYNRMTNILRNSVYNTNQTENIAALEKELASEGLNAAASDLLIEILQNDVFVTDQSDNINTLAAELGVSVMGVV